MASDSFIDGLKPRSEKLKETNSLNNRRGHFSSGYTSIEFGDSTATRSSRRQINRIVEQTKIVKKAPEPKRRTSPQGSYARDVLGIVEDDELEFDSEDIRRAKKERDEKRRKNRKKKGKKFIFRHKILSFIIIPIFILGLVAYFWGDSIMLKITNGRSGLFDFLRTVVTGNAELKVGPDGRTNILIFGTSGYDMQGSEGDGAHDGAQLTDSIMILSIDQKTKDVAMVSVPRDLKTDTCFNDKINELYYCENLDGKNENGGANALRNRVGSILGIDVQYYVHINWMSLIQIVDAIGGIDVTVDDDIDDDWTKTYIKAGVPIHLNGEQALGLARARHGTAHGDFTRGESQQKILIAIKEKISNMNFGVGEIVNLANILGENLRSDFDSDTIYAGAKVFSETNFNTIRQIPLIGDDSNYLTTDTIRGVSYVVPTAGVDKYDGIRNYIKQAFLKNPVILENAHIAVLNGSGVSGLAAKEMEELQRSVFNVVYTGDAPSGNYFEKIYLYALTDKPATKEKLETYYNTKALGPEEVPYGTMVYNMDFVIILGVGYSVE
ncbi:LCP family protein [Candidatus Saccharibacteria bacterium]|nr:LCP family protein [Candidatus Saccharibacteria bacterium]